MSYTLEYEAVFPGEAVICPHCGNTSPTRTGSRRPTGPGRRRMGLVSDTTYAGWPICDNPSVHDGWKWMEPLSVPPQPESALERGELGSVVVADERDDD